MKYIVLLTLLLVASATAQEFRATISGAVTDSAGAPIAGASLTIRETQTGARQVVATESTGQYTASFLLPGDYSITVRVSGFKEVIRKAIHVGAGDHPVIDLRLEVGDLAQVVEITADVPLVNSENASLGQTVTTKEVEDLPLNGRAPLQLAQLALGVMPTPFNSSSTVQQPYDSANSFSIGGTATQSSEILLDGAPNTTWDMRSAYSPPQDAVQEVRVKAFDTDTAFGRTGGGTINQILKSGTNKLHGSLYEFTQPSNLTANNFFNNRNGLGNPLTHYNQYGLTAGGPIFLPKVFDGRNKVFWFVAWENNKNSQPNNNFLSVPTAAQKKGDFTQVQQLYDPYSGTLNGSVITRQPFPGNQIPSRLFNPIAVKYLQFFPEPNVTGLNPTSRPDGYNNYGNNATSKNNYNNQLGRLDYNWSERNRMFFDVRHNALEATKNNYYQNIASGTGTNRENWGASLDHVFILSPRNLFNLRLNYTFMYEAGTEPSVGTNPTDYGFPAYIAANSQRLSLPYAYFSTSTNIGGIGSTGAANRPSQSAQAFSSYTRIQGNHVLKMGGDLRQYRLSTITYAAASGSFNFGGNSWVRQSSSSSATVAQGQDVASFLLGLPYQGFYDNNTYGSWYSTFVSGFVQDDWRARRNLTFNIGIRFDHDGPYQEKYGRTVTGFAYNSASPIAPQAIANYAKSPIAQLPADQFRVNGGLTYPLNGDTAIYRNTSHLISPRFGFAWSPAKFGGGTVIRGGVGMFVAPITLAYLSQNGNYSSNPLINQQGFSQQTTMTVTTNNYLTPGAATLSDPFPGGAILKPSGSSQGLSTFIGQNISFLNPEMKSPYSLRWNFGFQRALSSNTVLEMVYIGNHAVHLPVNLTQLNGIPRQYLSTLPTRDVPLITALNASVPNPFNGLIASGTPAGATTSGAQLLARYPQYPLGYSNGGFTGSGGVLLQNNNVGSSYFHSLNIRLQKRVARKLTLTANFIWSRLMEQTTWLNDTDAQPEKRVSPFDRTLRGVVAASYEIPFRTQSRLARAAFGGWLVNGIYTRQSGGAFAWIGTSSTTIGDYVYNGEKLKFNPREVDKLAFNTGAFDTNTANQYAYHIRTFGTTFSSLRGDGIHELNASVLKRIDIRERTYFQLRFECFNVANRPSFQFPNLAPTNSGFGLITAQSNRSRSIQAGARLVF